MSVVFEAGQEPSHTWAAPGLDALLGELETLPSLFVADLNNLLDEQEQEFEPTNDLAREQMAWFRAAGDVRRQVHVEIDKAQRKATFTFSKAQDATILAERG